MVPRLKFLQYRFTTFIPSGTMAINENPKD
jgi:hypothetical protein